MDRLRRLRHPHPPVAPQRAPPSPTPWARGYSRRTVSSPSPALGREREGPMAKPWEGEGQPQSVRHRGLGAVDVEGEILVVDLLVGAVGADRLDRGVEGILEL